MLVGSDGRIVKKHLHDKVLEKYVRQAVGDRPATTAVKVTVRK